MSMVKLQGDDFATTGHIEQGGYAIFYVNTSNFSIGGLTATNCRELAEAFADLSQILANIDADNSRLADINATKADEVAA